MSALFCVILLCFFWGCRVDLKAVTGDGLARENARAFRGILSVLVVCYHLSQRTGDRSLFHLFVFFGFLPVSYFFFLSGYGLQKSFAKKPDYRDSILKKRIPSVALPYLFFICLYWLLSCWEGTPYTPKEVLLSLVNGSPVVAFSWYIEFILLIYLAYYCTTRGLAGNDLRIPLRNLLFILAATALFRLAGIGAVWYSTCITYPLGILWAVKEEQWLPRIKARYYPLLISAGALFGIFFLGVMVFSVGKVNLWLYWPCCTFFVVTMILIQRKITFRNKLLSVLGTCSMEIYLFHGFFMQLFRGQRIYLENPLHWCTAVLICTGLAAFAMRKALDAKKKKATV